MPTDAPLAPAVRVRLIDHFVVGDGESLSFSERGLL